MKTVIEDEEAIESDGNASTALDDLAERNAKARRISLSTCYSLLRKQGALLNQTISEYETTGVKQSEEEMRSFMEVLHERVTLFGIAAHAMMDSCEKYMRSTQTATNKVENLLAAERQRTRRLEAIIHDVAKQHTILEYNTKRISMMVPPMERTSSGLDEEVAAVSDYSDDDENSRNVSTTNIGRELVEVDSLAMIRASVTRASKLFASRRHTRFAGESESDISNVNSAVVETVQARQRRHRVPDRPNVSMNAWSVLKNSIGQDLSKIPMPVHYNEPLSLLQRLTEEFEYSEILDAAAQMDDKNQQIAYIAAFTISTFSTTAHRIGKPFNPLLGETYEFDRTEDLGWRSIAEQVSHHPPIAALYCEGNGWTVWQEFSMKTKVRGKNLQVKAYGRTWCQFAKNGSKYAWTKPSTTVNNIIVGKMWLDVYGEVEIIGYDTASGIKCLLTFVPYSVFGRGQQREVNGVVWDEGNDAKYLLRGNWDSKVEIAEVLSSSINGHEKINYRTNDFETIWTKRDADPGSEKYHFFTRFACELNEMEKNVAPTDSRLRPDLRLMERGEFDESNQEKLRLEQKQRQKKNSLHRSSRQSDTLKGITSEMLTPHTPLWFDRVVEGNRIVHTYKGTYWKAKENQDWSQCPDIF